jgi:hypothetical protein
LIFTGGAIGFSKKLYIEKIDLTAEPRRHIRPRKRLGSREKLFLLRGIVRLCRRAARKPPTYISAIVGSDLLMNKLCCHEWVYTAKPGEFGRVAPVHFSRQVGDGHRTIQTTLCAGRVGHRQQSHQSNAQARGRNRRPHVTPP